MEFLNNLHSYRFFFKFQFLKLKDSNYQDSRQQTENVRTCFFFFLIWKLIFNANFMYINYTIWCQMWKHWALIKDKMLCDVWNFNLFWCPSRLTWVTLLWTKDRISTHHDHKLPTPSVQNDDWFELFCWLCF